MAVEKVMPYDICGATMLSEKEYISFLDSSDFHSSNGFSFWLREPFNDFDDGFPPGIYCMSVVNYNGYVNHLGYSMDAKYVHVKPALILSTISDMKDGDSFVFDDQVYNVILGGQYALCEGSLGSHPFDSRELDFFGSTECCYENSDVKKFIDSWYEESFIKEFSDCCKGYYSDKTCERLKSEGLFSKAYHIAYDGYEGNKPAYKHVVGLLEEGILNHDNLDEELQAADRVCQKMHFMKKHEDFIGDPAYDVPDKDYFAFMDFDGVESDDEDVFDGVLDFD